jgi:hypothetical protein
VSFIAFSCAASVALLWKEKAPEPEPERSEEELVDFFKMQSSI